MQVPVKAISRNACRNVHDELLAINKTFIKWVIQRMILKIKIIDSIKNIWRIVLYSLSHCHNSSCNRYFKHLDMMETEEIWCPLWYVYKIRYTRLRSQGHMVKYKTVIILYVCITLRSPSLAHPQTEQHIYTNRLLIELMKIL